MLPDSARAAAAAVAVALWAALDAASGQCDFSLDVTVGQYYSITNPNYPDNYKPDTQCRWRAAAAAGSRVQLSCGLLELPASADCKGDRVRVSLSGDDDLGDAQKYCGRGDFTMLSDARRLTMVLESTHSSAGGRFLCNITAVASAHSDCSCGMKKQARVVGGEETGVNEYPFMAALVDVATRLILCGASVVSEHYALTAAMCVLYQDPARLALLVGEHDVLTGTETAATKIYQLQAITAHPAFDEGVNALPDNDVALVRVQGGIVMSREVMPVCLPLRYTASDFANSTVEVLGWGLSEFGGSKANKLQKADLSVQTPEQCAAVYGDAVSSRQMCSHSAGKDACLLDIGGPLYWQDNSTGRVHIVGVVSAAACASDGPGVSTRVTSYLDWITDVIGAEDQYCVV